MIPILTPDESAALDRASAERGISVDALMENAGRAVARAAVELAGGAYGRRVLVVCGKGNNGGDGLVAARILDRLGLGVTVVLLPGPSELRGPAGQNLRRFAEAGGRWRPYSAGRLAREVRRADVVVDAVFGTGFRGQPEGAYREALAQLQAADRPVLAVDIPSGVEGETGAVRGPAARAVATVTFGALKPGVVFFPGAGLAGDVRVVDIGFPGDLIAGELFLMEEADAADLLPVREPESHKRSAGWVAVVAGSRSMTGAACLCARSAYRAGAGLVTLAVPRSILPVVQGAVAEATFLPLPETDEGTLSDDAWPELAERLEGIGAVAVGPGLTRHPSTAELVRRLVAESPAPFVLDADGLNAFEGRPSAIAARRSEAVLTPHAGEFGRLTGLASVDVVEDRVGHARKAAAEARATVLLKGSRTVIAEPDGRTVVNPTGGPFLATGGTGDVLTGCIGALMAAKLLPPDAAAVAAFVHGRAGALAAAELGPGVMAGDVAERIPLVMATLQATRSRRA
jgi:hydroxyethylthiazole kinase-like uncharacterized protein yjeF